jgi:hypothetical protein
MKTELKDVTLWVPRIPSPALIWSYALCVESSS